MIFAPDCIGPNIESLVAKMKPGDVMLLETFVFIQAKKPMTRRFPSRWQP